MKNIKLQTVVPLEKAGFAIGYDDPVMLIGSCFTENMGERMKALGFQVNVNPFGILYNPISICLALDYCLSDKEIEEKFVTCRDGLYHSWLHHGFFSRPDYSECIETCNRQIHEAHLFLQRCNTIVITLGSAMCFTHKIGQHEESFVVGNCHKVPEKEFERLLLTPDIIVGKWEGMLGRLLHKGIRVVFTISPVRHQAYGIHGNQIGKASLLLAVDELLSKFTEAKSQLSYFPAYEIMMDELRDYRFYADDLLHTSAVAEEIIWQRFQQTYMTTETVELCEQRDKENRRLAHRPIHG